MSREAGGELKPWEDDVDGVVVADPSADEPVETGGAAMAARVAGLRLIGLLSVGASDAGATARAGLPG